MTGPIKPPGAELQDPDLEISAGHPGPRGDEPAGQRQLLCHRHLCRTQRARQGALGALHPHQQHVADWKGGGRNDYYLIGIALLIFGYCIYEVVSDIDPRQQDPSDLRRNLLKTSTPWTASSRSSPR